jgi:amino acid transporter
MPYERDIEMDSVSTTKVKSVGQGSTFSVRERPVEAARVPSTTFQATLHDFVDSFRRDSQGYVNAVPSSRLGSSHSNGGIRYYDLKTANSRTANTSLSRELKGRHLQMIAIGGSIGEFPNPLLPSPPQKLAHSSGPGTD